MSNNDKFISLESLKEYNKQMKETYIEPLKTANERQQKELNDEVIIATFNIIAENTTITLQNLEGMTEIDWGDGTINSELSHTYINTGEYRCKIYNVTSIRYDAFRNCDSLTEIIIPDSVTSIESYAFYGCSSLTSVVIPDSVTSISGWVFGGCSNLTEIVIPDSVTSIDGCIFYNCSGLTSVVIPDNVTNINQSAFYGCSSLASVVIPDSVTGIGSYVFHNCSNLTIYCEVGSQPSGWSSSWNYSNCPVVWGYKHKDYPQVITELNNIPDTSSLDDSRIPIYKEGKFQPSAFTSSNGAAEIRNGNAAISMNPWGISAIDGPLVGSLLNSMMSFTHTTTDPTTQETVEYKTKYSRDNIEKNGKIFDFPTEAGKLVTENEVYALALECLMGNINMVYEYHNTDVNLGANGEMITYISGNGSKLTLTTVKDTAGNTVPSAEWYILMTPTRLWHPDAQWTGLVIFPTETLGIKSIGSRQVNPIDGATAITITSAGGSAARWSLEKTH